MIIINKLKCIKVGLLSAIGVLCAVPSFSAKTDLDYLITPVISEAQAKVSKIIEETYLNKNRSNLTDAVRIMSSERYQDDPYFKEFTTKIEDILDEAVKRGDIPIKHFYLNDIDSEKKKLDLKNPQKSNPTFIIPKVTEGQGYGIDALELYKYADNESIVQLSSQFNALESVSRYPSSVKFWPYDHTQGPRCALQAIAACKHRESASLQNKLPDAIQELLNKCIVKNYNNKNVPITQKYPDLYKNGYLSLDEINDEKAPKPSFFSKLFHMKRGTSAMEDLKTLEDHLRKNVGQLKFLSQWVRCEHTNSIQLQVFSAAPDCYGINFDDNNQEERNGLITKICKNLVANQYKAIAQVAAIRAASTGKQQSIHLSMVGQGAFHNPPEVMEDAIKAVAQEVNGYNIKVFLHGNREKSREILCKTCNELNIKYELQ